MNERQKWRRKLYIRATRKRDGIVSFLMIKCLLRGGLLYTGWIDVARCHKGTLYIRIYKPWKIGDPDEEEMYLFFFSLSRFIYFVFLFCFVFVFLILGLFNFCFVFLDSSCIHFPCLYISVGRVLPVRRVLTDFMQKETGGRRKKKHTQRCTHKDVTWHINIYCIIMEGPDRVLVDFFIFFSFSRTKVSGYYIYIYVLYTTLHTELAITKSLGVYIPDKTYDASGSAALSVSRSTESA